MLPHQERVVAEHNELAERMTKLSAFIESLAFQALPRDEQGLLVLQKTIMHSYWTVLAERRALWRV